jgi:proline iminopeptidase
MVRASTDALWIRHFNMSEASMRELYPALEAYHSGFLQVSDIHSIAYEEAGNPQGRPIVFLHGGPGGGVEPLYRQYFDPAQWRIVLFDQRGAGKSTPYADLRENTTWDLVEDIEKLRRHLGLDAWAVFGGSWGSTLALAYSETHPERCTGLVLRGIFMLRQKELQWYYQEGASFIFPDAWEEYVKPIPAAERGDMITAYYKRLTRADPQVRLEAARAWSIWEGSTSKLFPSPDLIERFRQDTFAEAFARIECHYFINGGFFDRDDQLLQNVHRIRHLPAWIIQGRYDVVCPMVSAWDLHRAWPEATLQIVSDAGHSATEAGIRSALLDATDALATL